MGFRNPLTSIASVTQVVDPVRVGNIRLISDLTNSDSTVFTLYQPQNGRLASTGDTLPAVSGAGQLAVQAVTLALAGFEYLTAPGDYGEAVHT